MNSLRLGRWNRIPLPWLLTWGLLLGAPATAWAGVLGDLGIGLGGGYSRLGSGIPDGENGFLVEVRLVYEPSGRYRFALIARGAGTDNGEWSGGSLGGQLAVYRDFTTKGGVRPYLGVAAGYTAWGCMYDKIEVPSPAVIFQDLEIPSKNLPELEVILGTRLMAGSHFCLDVSGSFTKPTRGYRASLTSGIAILF